MGSLLETYFSEARESATPPRYVYHVTTKPNTAKSILSKGINPMSVGSTSVGESSADKTYFFGSIEPAVSLLDSMFGDYEDPMATSDGKPDFKSWDAFDYEFAILRIDTSKIKNAKFFKDFEAEGTGDDWYFTTSFIPKEAIKIVPPKLWLQYLINFIWPDYGWSDEDIESIRMPGD